MQIEVFTDFACPFCYIAKTRLDQAIAQLGMMDEVELVYKAYQLKPDASKQQSPKIELKPDVQEAIRTHATEVGVTFNFDKLVMGNSENAHRLTKWAAVHGKGKAFFDAVIQRYFEAGLDLNREAELLDVVEELQLPVAEAHAVLQSAAYSDAFAADRYDAQQLQVTRVPFFVFNNRYGIIGVEPIEVFLKTLKQAK